VTRWLFGFNLLWRRAASCAGCTPVLVCAPLIPLRLLPSGAHRSGYGSILPQRLATSALSANSFTFIPTNSRVHRSCSCAFVSGEGGEVGVSGLSTTSFAFSCCPLIPTNSRVHRSCGCALIIGEGSEGGGAWVLKQQWSGSESVALSVRGDASFPHGPGIDVILTCNESITLVTRGGASPPHYMPSHSFHNLRSSSVCFCRS
jgi:hypothetical protein